jgi:glycosyltransferase involved in cell wall biosynthesis
MLYILQCGLVDYHSHYYRETLGQIAACRDQGVKLRLYANRIALEPIVRETSAIPAFRDAPDDLRQVDPSIFQLTNFITMGDRFAEDCALLSADGVGSGDIVFVPHARIRHLYGLAKWLATLPPEARPMVAVRFDDPDESWLAPGAPDRLNNDKSFTLFAIAELLELIPAERLLLFATTPLLSQITTAFTRHPCVRVPLAILNPTLEELEALRPGPEDRRAALCIAGQFRPEKGSELVADILTEFGRRFPGAPISLQVNSAPELDGLRAKLDKSGVNVPLITQVGECTLPDHYARLLAADIVLLPYQPHRYAARGSGIYAEAAACGVPMVVPRPTWMSRQIELGRTAGTSFDAFTVESIVDALSAAVDALPTLTEQAQARQASWHAEENGAEAIRTIMREAAGAVA